MNRPVPLIAFCIAIVVSGLSAQNNPQALEPAPPLVRVGPPPANASAAELEKTGDKLRAAKSYLDALDYYRAAVKKGPAATLWNKIGITELQIARYKDAGKSFERAIKLNPSLSTAYNNSGAAYYLMGAEQEKKAAERGKSLPRGARKNIHKAIKLYIKALELQEANASYHNNLGTAYFALKEYPSAANEYARALQLDPSIFERRSEIGVAAQLSSPEDHAQYSFLLARIYAGAGNVDEALQYLRRAMEDGYKNLDEVYRDQEFATVRKDPRFAALMASKPAVIPQ